MKTDPEILKRNKNYYYEKLRDSKTHCSLCEKDIISKFYKTHCQCLKHKYLELQKSQQI